MFGLQFAESGQSSRPQSSLPVMVKVFRPSLVMWYFGSSMLPVEVLGRRACEARDDRRRPCGGSLMASDATRFGWARSVVAAKRRWAAEAPLLRVHGWGVW